MKIFYHTDDIPPDFGPTIVSIGNFDGVHRAHTLVLAEMASRARSRGAKAVAVTFQPHPARILRPDSRLNLLTPAPEKLRLLSRTEIDAVLVLPFTRDLSLLSPGEFVKVVIVDALKAKEVHEGYNFHFGHRAAGNVQLLAELGRESGFEVVVYPEMRLRGESVSSTRIRELLREGSVEKARALLGRPFSIVSNPGRGRGYGARYTVPTINLSRYDELVPKDGVYVTRTQVGEECFDSVTNVGNRPTFGADSFAIESHLLDFHPLELTSETKIELWFLKRLRDEIKFQSVDDLRNQIAKDIRKARRCFALLRD